MFSSIVTRYLWLPKALIPGNTSIVFCVNRHNQRQPTDFFMYEITCKILETILSSSFHCYTLNLFFRVHFVSLWRSRFSRCQLNLRMVRCFHLQDRWCITRPGICGMKKRKGFHCWLCGGSCFHTSDIYKPPKKHAPLNSSIFIFFWIVILTRKMGETALIQFICFSNFIFIFYILSAN